jgi:hypothetical protein
MQPRLNQFVGRSAVLTGFSTVDLLGTAVAELYLSTLETQLPAGVTDDLLRVYATLPEGLAIKTAEHPMTALKVRA